MVNQGSGPVNKQSNGGLEKYFQHFVSQPGGSEHKPKDVRSISGEGIISTCFGGAFLDDNAIYLEDSNGFPSSISEQEQLGKRSISFDSIHGQPGCGKSVQPAANGQGSIHDDSGESPQESNSIPTSFGGIDFSNLQSQCRVPTRFKDSKHVQFSDISSPVPDSSGPDSRQKDLPAIQAVQRLAESFSGQYTGRKRKKNSGTDQKELVVQKKTKTIQSSKPEKKGNAGYSVGGTVAMKGRLAKTTTYFKLRPRSKFYGKNNPVPPIYAEMTHVSIEYFVRNSGVKFPKKLIGGLFLSKKEMGNNLFVLEILQQSAMMVEASLISIRSWENIYLDWICVPNRKGGCLLVMEKNMFIKYQISFIWPLNGIVPSWPFLIKQCLSKDLQIRRFAKQCLFKSLHCKLIGSSIPSSRQLSDILVQQTGIVLNVYTECIDWATICGQAIRICNAKDPIDIKDPNYSVFGSIITFLKAAVPSVNFTKRAQSKIIRPSRHDNNWIHVIALLKLNTLFTKFHWLQHNFNNVWQIIQSLKPDIIMETEAWKTNNMWFKIKERMFTLGASALNKKAKGWNPVYWIFKFILDLPSYVDSSLLSDDDMKMILGGLRIGDYFQLDKSSFYPVQKIEWTRSFANKVKNVFNNQCGAPSTDPTWLGYDAIIRIFRALQTVALYGQTSLPHINILPASHPMWTADDLHRYGDNPMPMFSIYRYKELSVFDDQHGILIFNLLGRNAKNVKPLVPDSFRRLVQSDRLPAETTC